MASRELVTGFLKFIYEESSQDLEMLSVWLDRLAADQETISFKFDETEYPDSPTIQYHELRSIITQRFPTLGPYNVTSPDSDRLGTRKVEVGDAVDDLVDIVHELADARWYFENTSVANALWHLENGFRMHWGRHLRDLQSYLLLETKGI